MDLLRFATAGSVDDGKSTLIGRLLYDSKGVFEDQLEAITRATVNRAAGPVDLSLLTDGLRAEREQGITIDVAYRYFATPKRKFIIADTPGHEQYTRNMATGSSTANLAIVLIDARHGPLVQSRRHTFIAALLGIKHLVIAVNKMDLVGWSAQRFTEIVDDFAPFCLKLGLTDVQFVPLSALLGDNVVTASINMPWFTGPTLLEHLEMVDVGADENHTALRFPVQYVIRPNSEYRGFAGQITSGIVGVGDAVVALPAGTRSKIARIDTFSGPIAQAESPQSVTLILEDEIDLSRGDLLVHDTVDPQKNPWIRKDFDAHLVWMDSQPLALGRPYLIKHTTRTLRAWVTGVAHRLDVNSLEEEPTTTLQLNEIGRVHLQAAQSLVLDAYQDHRRTGSFIVIDPLTNATVAAGLVCAQQPAVLTPSAAVALDRHSREHHFGHKSMILWMDGPNVDSTAQVADALARRLWQRGVQVLRPLEREIIEITGNSLDPAAANRLQGLCSLLLEAGIVVVICGGPAGEPTRLTLQDGLAQEDFAQFLVHATADLPHLGAANGALKVAAEDAEAGAQHIIQFLVDKGFFATNRVMGAGEGI